MKANLTLVREKDFGHTHEVAEGAPSQWAKERGATHTLLTKDGTRPAQLMKTRLFVGVDEDPDGQIKWEVWVIRVKQFWPNADIPDLKEVA